jgi:anaerobic ribonucleoside-triphosphate reductase activating protein
MNIHALLNGSRANGPGLRSVLWTQGCDLHCPSCWNPGTHAFSGGEEIHPNDLAERVVKDAAPGTTGLTISGGEPMHQADSVWKLIFSVKLRRPSWSVGMFSGYYFPELKHGDYDLREDIGVLANCGVKRLLWDSQLMPLLDWIVCGRYDRNSLASDIVPGSRPDAHFVSSYNQQLILLSNRHSYSDFQPLQYEVNISAEGLVKLTGFPV